MSSFNIFGSENIILPMEVLGPVYEKPYVPDPVKSESVSTEAAIAEPIFKSDRIKFAEDSLNNRWNFFMDCNEDSCCNGPKKKPVIFTKTTCKETNRVYWEFFMQNPRFSTINDFITKLVQVKPEDCVIIHGPSCIYQDDCEVMYAAIKRCIAKDKWISSPYVLNTESAFILTAGTKIISSVCNIVRITTPRISGGGAIQDATNSLNSSIERNGRMLAVLKSEGFITDEEMRAVINDQKSICLHGQRLSEIINTFNQKHI